jgi:hypothetical protein
MRSTSVSAMSTHAISQIEAVERRAKRMEELHGKDDPYAQDLRAQLAGMKREAERKAKGDHSENPVQFQVGVRNP